MMPNSLLVLLPFDEEALEQTMKGGSSMSIMGALMVRVEWLGEMFRN
jgi:hypothetical protein